MSFSLYQEKCLILYYFTSFLLLFSLALNSCMNSIKLLYHYYLYVFCMNTRNFLSSNISRIFFQSHIYPISLSILSFFTNLISFSISFIYIFSHTGSSNIVSYLKLLDFYFYDNKNFTSIDQYKLFDFVWQKDRLSLCFFITKGANYKLILLFFFENTLNNLNLNWLLLLFSKDSFF